MPYDKSPTSNNPDATIHEVTDAWEDCRRHDAEFNRLDQLCRDFLFKQRHFEDDEGYTITGRQQPKGTELNNQHRHKLAQILKGGVYLETHPRDQQRDPAAADAAKRLLEAILEDNRNRYRKVRRRVCSGGLGTGTWYGEVHCDPSRGLVGNVVFTTRGADTVFPCPPYLDVHDPLCPYVIIEDHLTKKEIETRSGDSKWHWKNTKDLWPDNHGKYGSQEQYTKASGEPSYDDTYAPDTITVLRCYYRTSDITYKEDSGERDLPSEEQYMGCVECGYRDDTHERMPDGQLPDVGMPCPQCLNQPTPKPNYLVKITRERITEEVAQYPAGRLVIVAPFQRRLFYDGEWQAPTRSFPLFQFRGYELPYEQRGGTDTLLYWSLQALMDGLRRQGYEQMVTSKPVVIFAGGPDGAGLVDANNNPFLMDDTNGQIAYAPRVTSLQGLIQHVQGNGLPPSFPVLYNILSSSFYQTQGTGDISFSPDRSRDVAYSSLKLQQETGDIAVDDHREVFREEEGLFLGCVLDVAVYHMTISDAKRWFGPEGLAIYDALRNANLQNVDVIVGSPPSIKQGAADEVNALVQWSSITNAAVRRIAARRLNIPPQEVAEVEAEYAQMQQQAQPAGTTPAAGGTPQFTAPTVAGA